MGHTFPIRRKRRHPSGVYRFRHAFSPTMCCINKQRTLGTSITTGQWLHHCLAADAICCSNCSFCSWYSLVIWFGHCMNDAAKIKHIFQSTKQKREKMKNTQNLVFQKNDSSLHAIKMLWLQLTIWQRLLWQRTQRWRSEESVFRWLGQSLGNWIRQSVRNWIRQSVGKWLVTY